MCKTCSKLTMKTPDPRQGQNSCTSCKIRSLYGRICCLKKIMDTASPETFIFTSNYDLTKHKVKKEISVVFLRK